MKKLLIILFFLGITAELFSQGTTLDNTGGRINNAGTIRVKNGQVKSLPDTLGGRMEFLQPTSSSQQMIPNIVYNQLVLSNESKKIVGDFRDAFGNVRPLTVMDSLIINNNAEFTTRWIGLTPEDILARSSVTNTAQYKGPRFLVLQADEDKEQDIIGNGTYSRLRIDNRRGVNVVGGGFLVEDALELRSGELRNSEENNFIVSDSSLITRYTEASLAVAPIFEDKVSIRYLGAGTLTTGPEIPAEESILQNLFVQTTDGIIADTNITVNDTLYIASDVIANNNIITLTSEQNPIFDVNNPNSEIVGAFRRTDLSGDTLLLNNPHTYARFATESDKAGIEELTFDIVRKEYPELNSTTIDDTKVERKFNISALDADGNPVSSGMNMELGYGWRHAPGEDYDESNEIPLQDIALLHSDGFDWTEILNLNANLLLNNNWARNSVSNISSLGNFALGYAGNFLNFTLSAKIFLEGAYRTERQDRMAIDLWERNLLSRARADEYPLNLISDFNPQSISIPDSVVDWVVIELRRDYNGIDPEKHYRAAFVRNDGTIVDLNGIPNIRYSSRDKINPEEPDFHIVVRHRNHSAIITQQLNLDSDDIIGRVFDFTRWNSYLYSGMNQMKIIGKTSEGDNIYGMRGGFFGSNATDLLSTSESDQTQAWQQFNGLGYVFGDFNLNGIVTTRDFNVSWNNRLKE